MAVLNRQYKIKDYFLHVRSASLVFHSIYPYYCALSAQRATLPLLPTEFHVACSRAKPS